MAGLPGVWLGEESLPDGADQKNWLLVSPVK